MPKEKVIDSPQYRGTARLCPSCEGAEVISHFKRHHTCETCSGTGVVHPGVYCSYCGRSVQFIINNQLVCGTKFCEELATKKTVHADPLNEAEGYRQMYGLVM